MNHNYEVLLLKPFEYTSIILDFKIELVIF